MANIVFLDDGGEGAQNLNNWAVTGTVTSDTGQFHSGTRAIKFDSTASNINAYVQKAAIMADAGRRVSFWFYVSAFPATSPHILSILTAGGSTVISVDLNSANHIGLETNTTNYNGATTLAINTWYHATFAYTVTSTTVNSFRIFLGASTTPEVTQTNITIGTTVGVDLRIGQVQVPGASKQMWIDDLYVDDGTTLDNPGDIRCTSKQPLGTSEGAGFNDWDTFVGTTRATGSRYLNIAERPGSDTNGWQQAATTQAYEKYLIQAASAGDLDISSYTLVGWMAWIRAKTAASSSVASIVDNDANTTISTTTAITNYVHATTSATFPSGRFGMRSTGTATDSFLYEVGVICAYIYTTSITTPQALSVTSSSSLLSSRQAGKLPTVASTATRVFGPTAVTKLPSLTSSGVLAAIKLVAKNPIPLHVDGIMAVLSRQANKSPSATSTSAASRDPFVVGKLPGVTSTATVSFGPKALARALSLTSTGVLSILRDLTKKIGPLHSDETLFFQRSVAKSPSVSSTSSSTETRQAMKSPTATSTSATSLIKLAGKLASLTSSAAASLIASTAHAYTQALTYTSNVALSLLRSMGLARSATSTSTSSRSTSAGKLFSSSSSASPARALSPGKSVSATSMGSAARAFGVLKAGLDLINNSFATTQRSLTLTAKSLSSSAIASLLAARTKLLALTAASSNTAASLRAAGKNVSATSTASMLIPRAINFGRSYLSSAQLALQAGANSLQSIAISVTSSATGLLAKALARSGPIASAASAGIINKAVTHPFVAVSAGVAALTRARIILATLLATSVSVLSEVRQASVTRLQDSVANLQATKAINSVRGLSSSVALSLSRAMAVSRSVTSNTSALLERARAAYLALSASASGTATRRLTPLLTRVRTSSGAASLSRVAGKLIGVVSDAILVLSTGSTLTFNQILTVTSSAVASLRRGAANARVAAATGTGSVSRSMSAIRAATATGLGTLARMVGWMRGLSAAGTPSLSFGQVFAELLAGLSNGVGSLVRSAGITRGANSVGVGSILRGVGKTIARGASALVALITRRLFRPGKPVWTSTGTVSLHDKDTGAVEIRPSLTGDVSIKERDYADL